MGSMSASDAAPLPRLGEVFFDVRGSSRSMRLSWYADTGVAVFSIWQGGMCTGTFRLAIGDLPRMVDTLQRGPGGQSPGRDPAAPGEAFGDVPMDATAQVQGLESLPGKELPVYPPGLAGYGPGSLPEQVAEQADYRTAAAPYPAERPDRLTGPAPYPTRASDYPADPVGRRTGPTHYPAEPSDHWAGTEDYLAGPADHQAEAPDHRTEYLADRPDPDREASGERNGYPASAGPPGYGDALYPDPRSDPSYPGHRPAASYPRPRPP